LDGEPRLFPPFGDRKEWEVVEFFRYVSKEGWLVLVPEDFLTDLASIPQWLRSIFGVNKRETVGAVIHDFGYRHKHVMLMNVFTQECRVLTRSEWDNMLKDVMILGGTMKIRWQAIFAGVRAGGWWTWRKR